MILKLALILLPILSYAQATIDVVYLLDGSIIRGSIIEQIPNQSLKIQSGENLFVYQMNSILKIVKEPIEGAKLANTPLNTVDDSPIRVGATLIGGTISYSSVSYEGKNVGSLTNIEPSLGYFFSNSTCLVLGILFNSRTQKNDYAEQRNSSNGFSAGMRFYNVLATNIGYAGIQYATITQRLKYEDDGYDDYSDDQTNNYIFFEVGILQKLNRYVYLDAGINYLKGLGDDKSGTLSFGIGMATFIN